MTTAKRPPLSKAERQRKIKAIQAEFEAKRDSLHFPFGEFPARSMVGGIDFHADSLLEEFLTNFFALF